MEIGYKGFDPNFRCRYFEFEIGKDYYTACTKKPRLCTSDGFHYCDDIRKVDDFYSLNRAYKYRFAFILAKGEHTNDANKSISTHIKILEDITELVHNQRWVTIEEKAKKWKEYFAAGLKEEEERKIKEKEKAILKAQVIKEWEEEKLKKQEKDDELYEKQLNLEIVRKLQTNHPELILVGSASLFLHGSRLPRWLNGTSDLDFISPYYINLVHNRVSVEDQEPNICECVEQPKSMNKDGEPKDQRTAMSINYNGHTVKLDVWVDPYQKYSIIEYKGVKYKVGTIIDTWKAKLKYGSEKHYNDLIELTIRK